MRLVHHAVRAEVAATARLRVTCGAVALALLASGLTACSGSESAAQSDAGAGLGAPLRSANCTDWNRGSPRDRQQSIEQIRDFAGGPVDQEGHGNTLDADKAYRLFENYCSHEYARGFKLYKLYTRAAAFSPQR